MLIISVCATIHAQEISKKDTVYVNDKSFDEIIDYSASDSTVIDLKNKKTYLYRNAKIVYGEITMTADFIMVDFDKNEVTATYLEDSLGNRTGIPNFEDGTEKMTASSIRYNFDSKKGYIQELKTQQDENFLFMGVAKRQANEEIHFENGRFTTCSLDEPHYHFQLSKAVMVPEKRIVSGPMNLWVKGIPTPLALPFIIIPQQKEKVSGLIFPQVIPSSPFGFGFDQLGYYLPINDNFQTTFFGTLYSRGSFGISNTTDYNFKYKSSGSFGLGYQSLRAGFPDTTARQNILINWLHVKDAKSNPSVQFRANVNFSSINDPQTNLDPANNQYLNNTFNSDIALDKTFNNLPLRAGIKLSARQSSTLKTIELNAPTVNLNLTQIFPLKDLVKSSQGWRQIISRFGVTYDMEGRNQSVFADSLLQTFNLAPIGQNARNGISQTAIAKTTAGFFKNTLKVNPSLNYRNVYNFQTTQKAFDATDTLRTELIQSGGMAQYLDFRLNATTVVYSYYKFAGKKKSLLRHVFTPTIGYNFIPNLNTNASVISSNFLDTVIYSRFERSMYASSSTRDQSLFTFSMNNTFELKRASAKDTVTGFRKIKIVDNFSVNGNYDFNKDSMNLSDLTWNVRISPFPFLSFQADGAFSPYNWDDSTNVTLKEFAVNERGTLGRLTRANFATSFTMAPKKTLEKINEVKEQMEQNWEADYQYFILHPTEIISFDIPWKATISHNFDWRINQNLTSFNREKTSITQTALLSGDVSFTKRWKLSGNASYDFETSRITYADINLIRDMHCWQMTFLWRPIGATQFFSFQMNAKATLFQDAKLKLQRPPFLL